MEEALRRFEVGGSRLEVRGWRFEVGGSRLEVETVLNSGAAIN